MNKMHAFVLSILIFGCRMSCVRCTMSRGESEYNLQLAFDINTDRHTQWFYFRMRNLRQGRPYKLNMQNLMKTEAVYNLGMQPLAYSQVEMRRCVVPTPPSRSIARRIHLRRTAHHGAASSDKTVHDFVSRPGLETKGYDRAI